MCVKVQSGKSEILLMLQYLLAETGYLAHTAESYTSQFHHTMHQLAQKLVKFIWKINCKDFQIDISPNRTVTSYLITVSTHSI